MSLGEGLAAALVRPEAGALLHTALAARFGQTARGRVDVAAGAGLGISSRTVRRWLHDEPDRSTVPAGRLELVLTALRPTPTTRTRERLELEHAEQGLRRMRLGARRGNLEQWAGTGWMQPHTVAVLELPSGLRRVAVTRDSAATVPRVRRGARLLEQVTVSSKFAAAVVRYEMLASVDGWRVEAGPAVLSRGHTQVWLPPAPLPSLEVLAGRRFRVRASGAG